MGGNKQGGFNDTQDLDQTKPGTGLLRIIITGVFPAALKTHQKQKASKTRLRVSLLRGGKLFFLCCRLYAL